MLYLTEKTIMKQLPSFEFEKQLWQQGKNFIAGVDEVGRGAFAGPVVAAAVILPPDFSATNEIDDSKRLSPKKREKLAKIIKQFAVSYSIAEISVKHINAKGVGKASQMAFRKAVRGLTSPPDFILIDAFYIQHLKRKYQRPIIHGDTISISIAAASIIAKVYRDALMEQLSKQFVHYAFAANKGYGTEEHQTAIKQHGLCGAHRTSFSLQRFLTH